MRRLVVMVSVMGLALPALAKLPGSTDRNAPPNGLQLADWTQIRAEYERHRHAMFPKGNGFVARSFEQQWLTHFDGRGFSVKPDEGSWNWGLALANENGRAQVSTDVNRITYRWGADLDEWFLNDTRGLEHGFTLRAPREIHLSVRGGLRPQLSGTAIEFVDSLGIARIRYSGLAAWDADGRALPARMKVESGLVKLAVDDRGARYPVTIDPIAQQAYLKASNTAANDYFGLSVAVSGDTVVVGAYWEDSSATGINGNQADNSALDSGAVYVFVRSGTTWTQQAYVKASNTGAGDSFGHSVAISGETLVVGASAERSNATGVNGNQSDKTAQYSGAAYVFVRGGGNWTQQAYLKASNTEALDYFGKAVAISGDTIVVGAFAEDSNATGVNGNQADNTAQASGAAYVFARNGVTWAQQAYLKASNTRLGDRFGYSVGVSGNTVIVGAYFEDSGATGVNGNQASSSAVDSGAAYVFVRNGAAWTQQAYLKASNTGATDFFGFSVGVSGDTVVVGAYLEDSNGALPNSGAAYVFARSGSTWTQQAYLKAANAAAPDFFGWSVAVSGDSIVVGASSQAASAGAAYVFLRSGATWSQSAFLKASNAGSGDLFGSAVAVSGDSAVVGAYGEASNATGVDGIQTDNSSAYSGAAYVFGGIPSVTVLTSPPPGSQLPSSNATFTWIAGINASAYWLDVGPSQGSGEYFSGLVSGLTKTVTGLPCTGQAIYARLWVQIGGVWQTPLDYTFTAASSCSVDSRAMLTSPAAGSTLAVASTTFTWTAGTGADGYWLDVGPSIGSGAYSSGQVSALIKTVSGLPCAGQVIYVRLWTRVSGSWLTPRDSTFTAAGSCSVDPRATLISPVAGSTLAGTATTFTWTAGSGADGYWLDVGPTTGSGAYSAGPVSVLTKTVTGLACTAKVVYARLWTRVAGVWQVPFDYTFTEPGSCSTDVRATLISPVAGSTLTGTSVSFFWTAGTGATDYWLDVGPSVGSGSYTSGVVAGLTKIVTGLPSTGQTIYVRLWARIGGTWQTPIDYTVAAVNSLPRVTSTGSLAGFGFNQTLTFRFDNPTGFANLGVVNVLLNRALDGGNACYIAYSQPAGILFLVNDAGPDAGLSAPLVLGSTGMVSNSQCAIRGTGSSAIGSGNTLTLALNMSFASTFDGSRVIYAAARNATETANSGWSTLGNSQIPESVSSFPRTGPMAPATVGTASGTVSLPYSDVSSTSNITTGWMLINSALDARNACYVAYFAPGNLVFLYPDNGDGAQATSMVLSGTNSLENSQCRISSQGSSIATAGGQLTLNLQVTMKASNSGAKGIWTALQTIAGQVSPWRIVGSWLVP